MSGFWLETAGDKQYLKIRKMLVDVAFVLVQISEASDSLRLIRYCIMKSAVDDSLEGNSSETNES